ncbi:MAG: IclR family transcriptional regulator [Thermodesulfobacteriota bacterium]
MKTQVSTHRSLEKALEILLAFMPHNSEMGTLDLAHMLGFHPSTVNRVLHVLANYGFVEQNTDTRKFVLSHAIVDLATAVQQSLSGRLTRIAIPHIEELRNKLGETVVLEVAGSLHTTIAHIAEAPGPIRIKENVGASHGYNAAAGAKCILAFSTDAFRGKILRQGLPRFTSRTITDPESLQTHLKEIRRRGFAFDDEERNTEIRAFGCPIFNHEKKPVASVVVAGPVHRITWERRDEIVPALKQTAADISAQLYYREKRRRRKSK